jgi:hypothetical protein
MYYSFLFTFESTVSLSSSCLLLWFLRPLSVFILIYNIYIYSIYTLLYITYSYINLNHNNVDIPVIKYL